MSDFEKVDLGPKEPEPTFDERREGIFHWIKAIRARGAYASDEAMQEVFTEIHNDADIAQDTEQGRAKLSEIEKSLASFEDDLDSDSDWDFPIQR